jgi:cellulase/cellobiase CelA1
MKRSAAITAVAGLVLAGTMTLGTAPAYAATTGCRAVYTVLSQWPGGFMASIAVTNLGDPINNWAVTFDFGAGQVVALGWNATWSQPAGAHVSAANAPYNSSLATGATATIGFNGTWTGSNPAPSAIFLNGTLCTGAVTTTGGSSGAA